MNQTKDYYQILGIPRDASAEDIKRAFRQLAHQYHPDLNPDPQAEDRMREINEAYEVLSDPDKRRLYDQGEYAQENNTGPFTGGFGDFGFGDLFDAFFGSAFRQTTTRERAPQRGADLRTKVQVTLKEVALGTEREITLSSLRPCPVCGGTGAEPGTSPIICPRCQGRGEVRQVSQSFFGQFVQVIECPDCHGEGRIISSTCKNCRGTGSVQTKRQIRVQIPKGVENGTRIRLSGEGEAGPKGRPPGDLYVTVEVMDDPRFRRSGPNLTTTVEVPYETLVLGGLIEVDSLLEGIPVEIPAGTSPDSQLTIRGKGLPVMNRNSNGDLIISIKVSVPKKISQEERELLERLRELRNSDVSKNTDPQKKNKGKRRFF